MPKLEMTSAERVMAALMGKEFDVFPAVTPTSVATIEGMRLTGVSFPSAHTDGEEMAMLAAVGHDEFGFDTVAPYFSVHLEAAALGAKIDWSDQTRTPQVIGKAFRHLDEFTIPDNFLARSEFQQLLRALRLLRKRYQGQVTVIGKVIGPWTLAYNLYGVERLILDTILEPKKTRALIEEISKVPLEFAKAQFEAGADIVTWAEHVTADLVSAKIYEEFVMPVHRRVTQTLHQYGPLILHVCGKVADRFQLIINAGFKCFHMDSRNDIAKAVEVAGDQIKIVGCINNPVTLSQGSPKDVRREVEFNLACGVRMIGPECAIPASVPTENLKELVQTAHSYSPATVKNIKDYTNKRAVSKGI